MRTHHSLPYSSQSPQVGPAYFSQSNIPAQHFSHESMTCVNPCKGCLFTLQPNQPPALPLEPKQPHARSHCNQANRLLSILQPNQSHALPHCSQASHLSFTLQQTNHVLIQIAANPPTFSGTQCERVCQWLFGYSWFHPAAKPTNCTFTLQPNQPHVLSRCKPTVCSFTMQPNQLHVLSQTTTAYSFTLQPNQLPAFHTATSVAHRKMQVDPY
mmetsp:Transcript_27154/g.59288  ORF Transcript_27154/g.59288 Transcript_27154/m.59288 type:complete len:213 (-) Transcript_27154:1985-2623(-)